VGAATRQGCDGRTAQAVAQVVYSSHALDHLERAHGAGNGTAIQSAVEGLAAHPLVGSRVDGDVRELVVSFGATGYIALYRFVIQRDEVRVLALRHQREVGYLP
jgi:plasmid stabilization system protein ParE